ncbi:hypothetical protein Hdeb2414_s0018g00532921 [Helianthus debilis subsp. tardiflorus]
MDQNAKNKNGHATIPPCCLKAQVLLNWKPIVMVQLFQDGSLSIGIHLEIDITSFQDKARSVDDTFFC